MVNLLKHRNEVFGVRYGSDELLAVIQYSNLDIK